MRSSAPSTKVTLRLSIIAGVTTLAVSAAVGGVPYLADILGDQGIVLLESGRTKDALLRLRTASFFGNDRASFRLGLALYDLGDKLSRKDAVEAWMRAAKSGHIGAQVDLGVALLAERRTRVAESKARSLWRKASARGSDAALFNLGLLDYEKNQTSRAAAKVWSKAAANGSAAAQFNLGVMSLPKAVLSGDYGDALTLFRVSAASGHALGALNAAAIMLEWDGRDAEGERAGGARDCGLSLFKDYPLCVPPERRIEAADLLAMAPPDDPLTLRYQALTVNVDSANKLREIRPKLERAADAGDAESAIILALLLFSDKSAARSREDAVKWLRTAANKGNPVAKASLGSLYFEGKVVPRDERKAAVLVRQAAEKGVDAAQFTLGLLYLIGKGVGWDRVAGRNWLTRAANQGHVEAQYWLAKAHWQGGLLPTDLIQSHRWALVARSSERLQHADEDARLEIEALVREQEVTLSAHEQAQAQRLASSYAPRSEYLRPWQDRLKKNMDLRFQLVRHDGDLSGKGKRSGSHRDWDPKGLVQTGGGTGFLVSRAGHVVTNGHVVASCTKIGVRADGTLTASTVVRVDQGNDLAVVWVEGLGQEAFAPIRSTPRIRLGEKVMAAGYPLASVLGSGLKVTSGEISALSGVADNTRYLQISAPVQPGNSGGPLLDVSGNVLGVVTAKLDGIKMAAATGDIPQNVNFAINASTLLSFLDAVGVEVERGAQDRILASDQIAEAARQFTVQVECYSGSNGTAVAGATPLPSLKTAAARVADYAVAPKGKTIGTVRDKPGRGADLYTEAEALESSADASKLPKALKLYQQAAKLGYAPAQHKLGVFYFFGKGTPRDYAQAAKWHRKAADQGDAHAQYDLGLLYEWGKGVPKSRREAIAWYTKAAGKAYPDAEQALQRLGVAH